MLRIKGGKVYDPANGVHGEVRDVCVSGGRVVASVDGGRTIDATGMVVFPGGVDVHTHVAGAALNFARGLIPEQHRNAHPLVRNAVRRAGVGGSTPTTFATGYLARPLGGVIFGHYGDLLGRKKMLVLTMSLMGVASFLIGLLPTYAQVGWLAPAGLILLRVLQGISVGGEWGGAVLMSAEHATSRRGLWASFTNAGAPCGMVLSTAALTGTPFASPLPRQTKSGSRPFFSNAYISPVRPKFACTSSRMNRMSCARQNFSSSCRYDAGGW